MFLRQELQNIGQSRGHRQKVSVHIKVEVDSNIVESHKVSHLYKFSYIKVMRLPGPGFPVVSILLKAEFDKTTTGKAHPTLYIYSSVILLRTGR